LSQQGLAGTAFVFVQPNFDPTASRDFNSHSEIAQRNSDGDLADNGMQRGLGAGAGALPFSYT
jgi:hypothetical protein